MRLLRLALLAVILGLVGSFYAQYKIQELPRTPLICNKTADINRGQFYMFWDCERKYPERLTQH